MASVRYGLTALPYVFDPLHHPALPALTLGLHHIARMARVTRASLIEVLGGGLMRSAEPRGCPFVTQQFGWTWGICQGCASLNLPIFIDITIGRMVQRATCAAHYAAIASEAGGGSHGIAQVG